MPYFLIAVCCLLWGCTDPPTTTSPIVQGNPLELSIGKDFLFATYRNTDSVPRKVTRNPGSAMENLNIYCSREGSRDTFYVSEFSFIFKPDNFVSTMERHIGRMLQPGEPAHFFKVYIPEIALIEPKSRISNTKIDWIQDNKLIPGTYYFWYSWPYPNNSTSNTVTYVIP